MTATLVNASFCREKPVDFSQYGPCREAILYTSSTVLPPSAFEKRDILEQARNGSLCMPPHSVLLLRF